MRVLGISDGMTGGAALIEDGKIISAIHEERLIRAKMATGFPRESICNDLSRTITAEQSTRVRFFIGLRSGLWRRPYRHRAIEKT
jgi:predicted NodU family carbamoyl transferase